MAPRARSSTFGAPEKKTVADELLLVHEVAERIRQGQSTVYRKIAQGEIPAMRLGERGPLRISTRELEAWLYGTRRP